MSSTPVTIKTLNHGHILGVYLLGLTLAINIHFGQIGQYLLDISSAFPILLSPAML